MIKKILILLILTFVFGYSSTSWAQNIRFVHNQLTKAKTKAKKKSKILFVDAYASWCGPCKMMDKNIFTDPTVVKFHKTNFVNCKIDVESVVGDIFTDQFPIKSIPTLFYFNSDYDLIFKKVGAPSQAEDLIEYGQTAFDVPFFEDARAWPVDRHGPIAPRPHGENLWSLTNITPLAFLRNFLSFFSAFL